MKKLLSRLMESPRNLEVATSAELEAFLRGVRVETWAGVDDVSVNRAQQVSAWFAGNRNVAEDIGKLPFIVYESGESRRRATESPYWTLVHDRASTRWTSQGFREYMTFWAQQDGDAFALKLPLGALQVRELIPFKRGEVEVELTDDGEFIYRCVWMKERQTFTRRDVFHLQGFAMHTDGGAELFQMSREDIALSLAAERHGATFFGNGAHPSGMLVHPNTMSETAYKRLKASMQEEFGRENSHTPLLGEEGLKWEQFGLDNEAAQFVETREFQVTEHARRLRLPPHKVGDNKHATFSNIEHQAIEYVTDSLLPWALRWENAFNQQVIRTNAVYAELLLDALLRGDSMTRAEVYSKGMQNGWLTQNDIRRRENMPPLPGGDVLYTQVNMASPEQRDVMVLKGRAEVARLLVAAGYEPGDVLVTAGLPAMDYIGTQSATTPEPPGGDAAKSDVEVAA